MGKIRDGRGRGEDRGGRPAALALATCHNPGWGRAQGPGAGRENDGTAGAMRPICQNDWISLWASHRYVNRQPGGRGLVFQLAASILLMASRQ